MTLNNEKIDKLLSTLSDSEQECVRTILKEYTKKGSSELLNGLYENDFTEVPVSIDEFIESDQYAGWFTGNGKQIFPYWRKKLREIFDEKNNYSEIVLGGCLTGDTVIPLLNGKKVTMSELVAIGDLDEYVYSYDLETNRYVPGHLVQAFSTGIKEVYEIILDDGSSFKATSTHKFLTRDKHWKSIDTGLSIGDSLMPLYRTINENGYEVIQHPQKDGSYVEEFTHKMVLNNKRGDSENLFVTHHRDENKLNNDPRNLLAVDRHKHWLYHAHHGGTHFKNFNDDRKNGRLSSEQYAYLLESAKKGCISRWSIEEEHQKMSNLTTKRMNSGLAKYMSDKAKSSEYCIKKRSEKISKQNTDSSMIFAQQVAKACKISRLAIDIYGELSEQTYNQIRKDYGFKCGYPAYKSIIARISNEELYDRAVNYNHRIVSITRIGYEEVYDLTVEKYHNFCLDCGIVAHNSIGCGKSTIAVIGLAYSLYWLMCLKDPNPYFGLGRGDTIYIVFFNATLQLSRGVAYSKFQDLLQHSPWFLARGTISGTKYLEYTPNKTENSHIAFTVGSQPEHSLGKAIAGGILDECNFTKGANIEIEKSKIMETYTSVLARIKSRFIVGGKVRGRLFLVSSKKSEYDFIEAYVRKVKGNPGVYIAEARLYELKAVAFSGEKFRVAVGGSNLPSRIIPDDEDSETYIAQGYEIEAVPIELKQDFQLDMTRALRDHCGIAVSGVTRFIAYTSLEKCIIPQKNPFKSNVIYVGMLDQLKYEDFFEPHLVPQEIYTKPLFIHFDCSLTGDRTGISCIAVLGYTNREGYDSFTGEHVEIRELAFRQVFSLGIQCPSGSEISFRKNREFIYYLKYTLGWNIKGISLDSFQSADLKQSFITAGFEDTSIVSLDRKPDGYQFFKTALIERRIQVLSNQQELFKEIVDLKQDNLTGKVDHPIDGSKDIADSFAGAIYNASLHDGQFAFHLVDNAMLFGEVNDVPLDDTVDFVNGLISNPNNAIMNRPRPNNQNNNQNNGNENLSNPFAEDSINGFLAW